LEPIPWSKIENWFCIACGNCCREFKVPLSAYEAIKLAEIFGYDRLELGLKGYYLRKRPDRRCVFQVYSNGKWICGIQSIKPLACRLWPFMVRSKPRHGYKDEAEYEYKGQKFYVYVNPYCRGLIFGKPSRMLIEKVIPEFIELSMGLRVKQELSTSLLVGYNIKGLTQISLDTRLSLALKGLAEKLGLSHQMPWTGVLSLQIQKVNSLLLSIFTRRCEVVGREGV